MVWIWKNTGKRLFMWKRRVKQNGSATVWVWSRRTQNYAVALFLFFVMMLTCGSVYVALRQHHGYIIGDWLINYQGGFVRRGLFGELAIRLSDALPFVRPDWVAGICQIFLYMIFLVFSYLNLLRQPCLKPYWILIFSPFLFCFQIITIGGGGRKEIIFFALLSVLVWVANTASFRRFRKVFGIMLLFYPLAVLTHEMLILFLPYLFIVYFIRDPFRKKNLRWQIPLLSLSLVALFASLLFPGTDGTATGISQSLLCRGVVVGADAVNWLRSDIQQSVMAVRYGITNGHFISIYTIVLILVGLGFLPLLPKIRALFENRAALFLFLFSCAGSCLLAVVAIDWGRWIYIHATALFLVLLVQRTEETPPLRGLGWPVLLLLSGVYFSVWNIPSYGEGWPVNINACRMIRHIQGDNLLEWTRGK